MASIARWHGLCSKQTVFTSNAIARPLIRFSFSSVTTRALALVVVLLGCLFETSSASAQSISFQSQSVRMRRLVDRDSDQDPRAINRADCINDDPLLADYDPETKEGERTYLQMSVALSNVTSRTARIEVWASQGADCTDLTTRQNSGNCNLVAKNDKVRNGVTANMKVRPRVVVSGESINDVVVDDPAQYPAPEICDTSTLDAAFSFYVILFDGNNIIDSLLWSDTRVDLVAPAPPETINANPGDETIFLDWEVPTADEDADSDGYVYYCVAVGSGGGVGGAGGASNASCGSLIFRPGELPPVDEQYKCGRTTGRSARKGVIRDLDNSTDYAVAVASVDIRDNSGVLSEVICPIRPKPVTTFFERYQQAGGQGGGGYCSISPLSSPHILWLSGAALGLLLLRRFRRRSAGAGDLSA